jgi:hypothetical protein
MNVNTISENIGAVLKDANLKQTVNEFIEVIVDSKLSEGFLKELPGTNILVGAFKSYTSIPDALFVKKLSTFLKEIKDIPLDQRDEMVAKIDLSTKHRTKVGETILYIIDKCDDPEKAQLNAVLFKAVAQNKIDYDDFLRCSLVIRKCLLSELKWFVKSTLKDYDMNLDAELFNWGLLEFAPLDLKIEQKRNGYSGFEITDKKLKLKLSPAGEILRTYLKEFIGGQFKDLNLVEKNINEIKSYISSFLDDIKKEKTREKLESTLSDVICEVCNNYVLDDLEASVVFTYIMNILGKHTIRHVSRLVENKSIEANDGGNEFNLKRWSVFSNTFIEERNLQDFRGDRL